MNEDYIPIGIHPKDIIKIAFYQGRPVRFLMNVDPRTWHEASGQWVLTKEHAEAEPLSIIQELDNPVPFNVPSRELSFQKD